MNGQQTDYERAVDIPAQRRGVFLPPTVEKVGMEMGYWSDLDQSHGAFRGRVAAPLLRAVIRPGMRVLVAGPHTTDVIHAAAEAGAQVTVLLRSEQDAKAVRHATDATSRPAVLCGSIAEMLPEPAYDLVVALDGLHRLTSAEGDQLSWAEVYHRLVGLLLPGGSLLLSVPNALGVHHLVAMSPADEPLADADWSPEQLLDETRPGSPDRLRRHVEESALTVRRMWAAYPSPSTPSLLIAPDLLADRDLVDALDGPLAAAWTAHLAGRAVLSDPRTLTRSALVNGLALELAPAWLVLATASAPAPGVERLPDALVGDPISDGPFNVTVALSRDDLGDVHVRTVDSGGAPGPASGLSREIEALNRRLPTGRSLQSLLLAASRRHDVPEIDRLLLAYADWLRSGRDEWNHVAGSFAFATFDNVVLAGDRLVLLDPSWSFARQPLTTALARAVRGFAALLQTGGHPHPWPSTLSVDALATVLASRCGVELTTADLTLAIELEVALTAAAAGLDAEQRAQLDERVRGAGVGTPPPGVDGYRDLMVAQRRLRAELAHAHAKINWLDDAIATRDETLRGASRTADQLRRSMSYRVGRRVLAPGRGAVNVLRAMVNRYVR
ncbi:MAG: hypothetical protein HOV79_17685 [Hamadaea sp.]|nr:hypothetical protein [Hamadaea sp.]